MRIETPSDILSSVLTHWDGSAIDRTPALEVLEVCGRRVRSMSKGHILARTCRGDGLGSRSKEEAHSTGPACRLPLVGPQERIGEALTGV